MNDSMQNMLFLLHGAFLLVFGVVLSAAFADIRFSKTNLFILLGFCLFSGLLQTSVHLLWNSELIWTVYPLIAHLPLVVLLWRVFRRKIVVALMSVFTAYLCCQPCMWLGLIAFSLSNSELVQYLVHWVTLAALSVVILRVFAPYLAQIYRKDLRSALVFGIIPTAYYFFDYSMAVYTNLWMTGNRVVLEFLPFLLCVTFFLFCLVYYKEYEQKADAQRKEQMISISVQQQAKEVEIIKRSEQELRLMRHDMRMLLSTIALSVEENDRETALKLIHNNIDKVNATALRRFCTSPMVNYVLGDYAARFEQEGVAFDYAVEFEGLQIDETMFCSILSNALDNALNAQRELLPEQKKVELMLKNLGGKLLLSVRNQVKQVPL
ncbi:MAG: GHKL domain-containing protein, partial [Oscillospiraceae bacterium]|nr:GHKL domain-containing protein [Oscillospiraceae bacterium]